MTQDKTPADSCGCSAQPESAQPKSEATPQKGRLSRLFAAAAGGGGVGALGFVAGHAGCWAPPLIATTLGITGGLTAGASALVFAFGAAATAGGVYAWHKLRGPKAGKLEKTLVIGSAVAGLTISGAMHLARMGDCHGDMPCHSTGAQTMPQTMPMTHDYCGAPPAVPKP